MRIPLEAALIDVGGTLWPDHVALSDEQDVARLAAVEAVLPAADPKLLSRAVHSLLAEVECADAARRRAVSLIRQMLSTGGWPDDDGTVDRVRRALCVELGTSLVPHQGAAQLLSGLKSLGLRCVILSNTTFQDVETYERAFSSLGWAVWLDGCVTSVDVGCAKPDPRIFQRALTLTQCRPERCVMIGNSEAKDIVPARRLGLRTVRVAIEEPPAASQADATVTRLPDVLAVVRSWQ